MTRGGEGDLEKQSTTLLFPNLREWGYTTASPRYREREKRQRQQQQAKRRLLAQPEVRSQTRRRRKPTGPTSKPNKEVGGSAEEREGRVGKASGQGEQRGRKKGLRWECSRGRCSKR